MDLGRKLLKEFADVANANSEKVKSPVNVYGYVKVVDGAVFVNIDGSPEGVLTPVSEAVAVQDGDRVLVSLGAHTAIVTGNFTAPPTSGGGKHIHQINDVYGLQSALDGKADDVEMDALESAIGNKAEKDHIHEKLEGLANIKSIGNNLTLAEDGTLSASGGGGGSSGGGTIDYEEYGSGDIQPLGIEQGGTGGATVAEARNNLGLGNTSGALPIANGGTGVTTLADIKSILGITSLESTVRTSPFVIKTVTVSVTIAANSYVWATFTPPTVSGYTVIGMVGADNVTTSAVYLFGISSSANRVGLSNPGARKTVSVNAYYLYRKN